MNFQDRINAAREAVNGAYQDFNQAEMGSPDFFAYFSTWNRLNSELNSLEKVQNLITADAFAGIGADALTRGIERIFSTGMQYAPSMITAQSIQNAANSAMFGQGALDTFSSTLDFAQAYMPSNMSDNYVPYGGAGGGFSNFNDDNASSNYDQSGSGVDNFSSSDPKDYSGQYDGNSNAQTSNDNGTLIDNGASYSSIMSGDYLGTAELNSVDHTMTGTCHQLSGSARDIPSNATQTASSTITDIASSRKTEYASSSNGIQANTIPSSTAGPKIGQRAKWRASGKTGTIIELHSNGTFLKVKFDEGGAVSHEIKYWILL